MILILVPNHLFFSDSLFQKNLKFIAFPIVCEDGVILCNQLLFWPNCWWMRVLLALTSSCLPLFIVAYKSWKYIPWPGIGIKLNSGPSTWEAVVLPLSYAYPMTKSYLLCIIDDRWLKKIEYDGSDDGSQYNWLLHNQLCNPSIITIENRYQTDFGNPVNW